MRSETPGDEGLQVHAEGHVYVLELRRPPHNYLSEALVGRLADTLEALDAEPLCRAIVLAAEGRSFCAGADFRSGPAAEARDPRAFYAQAMRLFGTAKPIVAAVQGPAVGAGLGLALAADFRVGCPQARFSANFNRMGFHPGFGLSFTLPRLVGPQEAALLFYTGRRVDGDEALRLHLVDRLAPTPDAVRGMALALAQDIADSGPIAIEATRQTLRQGLAQQVRAANEREIVLQQQHFRTADCREGIAAMNERRKPQFRRE